MLLDLSRTEMPLNLMVESTPTLGGRTEIVTCAQLKELWICKCKHKRVYRLN